MEIWPNGKGNLELYDSVPQIGADDVHAKFGVTGQKVVVAVVDSGIDSTHSEFQGRILDRRALRLPTLRSRDHGTRVAGIIGAAADGKKVTGVAPNVQFLDAELIILHQFDNLFDEGEANYGDAIDAINWAVSNTTEKVDVINMSQGWEVWEYGRDGSDPMSLAINQVVSDGVVFVKSAGNNGKRRVSGTIEPASDPIRFIGFETYKFFKEKSEGDTEVYLLWYTETNNLDLAILDANATKEIDSSRTPTTAEQKTASGAFYEKITLGGALEGWYSLRVEADFSKENYQHYEAWVGETAVLENPDSRKTVSIPGYSEKAITVGAVDEFDHVTEYSSQGPTNIDLMKPEIVAPGGVNNKEIYSTVASYIGNDYGRAQGTSMAAPHVAGVAALILDAVGRNDDDKWNFSPDEVKSAIVRGAEELTPGPDNTYGAGLVRADNVIFGGKVSAGEKLYFKITPRLLKSQFDEYFLNAENAYPNKSLAVPLAVAISWENSSHDLDLSLSTANQSLRVDKRTGAGYQKIIFTPNQGNVYYLRVHNKSKKDVTFTGAATHPIEELPDNSDVIAILETVSPIKPSADPDLPTPTDSGQEVRLRAMLNGHTGFVSSLAFDPNGQTVVSGSWDNTIRLWNLRTEEHLTTLTGHTDRVTSIAFSANGNMLASGSWDKTVRFWNPNSGKFLRSTSTTRVTHETFTSVVAADSHGDSYWFASGSLDNHVWLWYGYGLTTQSSSYRLPGHTHDVSSVAFSADERTLASGSHDHTIKLWDISDRKLRATLKGHTDFVTSVAFSPDGRTLASGSWDNTIRLWDVATGKSTKTLNEHTDRVLTVAFSPDGRTLASGSDDQTIRLWNVETGQQRDTLLGHTSGVTAVTFSPDRKTLASAGGWDNTVRLWDLLPAPTPAPTVSIAPSPIVSPTVGKEFVVKVNIAGVQDVAGYQATVHFDPSALRYVESANGNYLPTGALFVPPVVSANQVTLAATSLSGESDGAGTLTTLTFEVVAVKPSQITLSDVMIMKQDLTSIPIIVKNGDVVVSSEEALDVNGDGVVDILDLTIVATHFSAVGENQADVNGDSVVDIKDLLLVAGAINADAAAPSTYPRAISTLTLEEIQMWLSQAQQLDLSDATYQRGFAVLQQLLTALTPKETALLPNYPNPFNPETWIPYQLAKPADVTLTIYDVRGVVVRELRLGHKPAGVYQRRSRAIHWDGRNAVGEPVASGVYFYTLTAGEFAATRKMLIAK